MATSPTSLHPPVSPSEYPANKDDYELLAVIGRGATATVYAAKCKPRDEKVAIKCIDLEKYGANIEEIRKEIQAMSQCHHENVVTYYTSFVVKEELWLVMRLLEGGSALEIMKYFCPKGYDELLIASILKEVLQGLAYFHKNGQIHRDVKAGNILIDSDGTVQLADFGVSSWLVENGERRNVRQTFVGTPCWMAPEVMEQVNGYDYKADIWSFGITAIELATGHAPFAKYSPMKVLMLTLQNPPPTLDLEGQHSRYSKTFKKMVDSCLQKDPTKRPTAVELLKHDFFKKTKAKDYIVQSLLVKLPPLASRVNAKPHKKAESSHGAAEDGPSSSAPPSASSGPRKGESGRYRKNESGEWDFEPFSEDEESDDEEVELPDIEESTRTTMPKEAPKEAPKPSEHPETASSDASSASSQSAEGSQQAGPSAANPAPGATGAGAGAAAAPDSAVSAQTVAMVWQTAKVVDLKLRLRDKNKQLKDIRFSFTRGEDTPAQISRELVDASLIDPADVDTIADHIGVIIDPSNRKTSLRFPLAEAALIPDPDVDMLKGYAQLLIC